MAGQTFPFDPTGKLPSNKIVNEYHVITAANWRTYHFIVPKKGPYFEDSLVLSYRNTSNQEVKLKLGIDWVPSFWFIGASRACAKNVYGGITFLNTQLTGNIKISYQTIGGEWVLDEEAISEILADHINNPLTTTWEAIAKVPKVFPPEPHEWDLTDMVGEADLIAAINDITTTIRDQGGASLEAHLQDHENPHRVTKSQVGLGLVENFPRTPLATAGGATDDKSYTTPAVVRAIIGTSVNAAFEEFKARRDNPHNVTAAQVGAYSKTEMDTFLNDKLSKTGTAFDSSRLDGRTYSEVKSDILSGTAANATKLNGRTFDVLKNEIAALVNSKDTFGGKNPSDFRDWVLTTGTASNSNELGGYSVTELIEYYNTQGLVDAQRLNGRTDVETRDWILRGKSADSARLNGYTYEELLSAVSANVGGNATRLQGKSLAEILEMVQSNTIAFDSSHVFGMTKTELYQDILRGTASNTMMFNNKNYNDVKSDILTGTAANSTKLAGYTLEQILVKARTETESSLVNASQVDGKTPEELKAWVLEGVAHDSDRLGGLTKTDVVNEIMGKARDEFIQKRTIPIEDNYTDTSERWYSILTFANNSIDEDNGRSIIRLDIDNLFNLSFTGSTRNNIRVSIDINLDEIRNGRYGSGYFVTFELLGKYDYGKVADNITALKNQLKLGYYIDTENTEVDLLIKIPYNHSEAVINYIDCIDNAVYPNIESVTDATKISSIVNITPTVQADKVDLVYKRLTSQVGSSNTTLNTKVTELTNLINQGDANTLTAAKNDAAAKYATKSSVTTNSTNITNLSKRIDAFESGDKVGNAQVVTEVNVLKTKINYNVGDYIKAYVYKSATASSKSVSPNVDSANKIHIYFLPKTVPASVSAAGITEVVQYGIFELNYKDSAVINWASPNIQHTNGQAPTLEVGKVYLFNVMMFVNTRNSTINRIVLNDLGSIGNAY